MWFKPYFLQWLNEMQVSRQYCWNGSISKWLQILRNKARLGRSYKIAKNGVDEQTKINVSIVEPGLIETNFSVIRFGGDQAKADNVYKGVDERCMLQKFLSSLQVESPTSKLPAALFFQVLKLKL